MNININNYEEYFLLYADNELSASERNSVELFINEHPEYEEELEMITDAIMVPDEEVSLSDKSFLLKKEDSFINKENYESLFVLYHDNELSPEERINTELFLKSEPSLKSEFDGIAASKLEPEAEIVFMDKKSLYRKEKSGKLVPMFAWKMMAAAVFIGFGLWTYINYQTGTNDGNTTKNTIAKSELKAVDTAPVSTLKSPLTIEEITTETVAQNEQTSPAIAEPKTLKEKIQPKQSQQKESSLAVAQPLKKTQITIETIQKSPVYENKKQVNEIAALSQSAISVPDLESRILENSKEEVAIAVKNTMVNTSNDNIAKNTLNTLSVKEDRSNDNYIFFNVPADEFNRTKVGAFLKKVRRIVDRNDPMKLIFAGEKTEVAKNI